MPKTAYDFSKEMLFYMIKCNDNQIEDVYVGSTFEFTKRKSQHKTNCNNEKERAYNFKIYQTIRANGGWDNYNMNVIDRKVVIDKLEARQHEQTLIEKHKASLNSRRAYTDKKQYDKEKSQKYYENNRDAVNEYQREYYENNRDTVKEQQREYREKKRDDINEKQRERRRKLKENQSVKTECIKV